MEAEERAAGNRWARPEIMVAWPGMEVAADTGTARTCCWVRDKD